MRIFISTSAMAAVLLAGVAASAANMTVEQAGQHFSERSLDLHPGDSLTFANKDDVNHNITVVDDDSDDEISDLGLQKPGENLNYKFDRNGKFKVRCHIHPSMKMTVNVK